MANYTVSNKSELQSALSKASGGDTILLKSGSYGDLSLSQDFSSDVTIKSIDPLGAKFGGIDISGASHIVLDGLRVNNGNDIHIDIGNGSKHITVQNSEVGADSGFGAQFGIRAKDSSDIAYIDNFIHNVSNGTAMFQTDDVVVSGNVVDWVSADSYKFSEVDGGLVENNWGAAHVRASEDAHNDFMQFQGGVSKNFVIRGNVLLPAEGENATTQGIFGNINDSLVEQNIIVTANARGISVKSGNIVRENTILDVPGQAVDETKIYYDSGTVVENNIWTSWNSGTQGSNIIVQHDDPKAPYYIYDLFTDFQGTGTTLEGLIPVDGSAADGKGAYDLLIALLDGELPDWPSNPTDPEPEPEPEPQPEPEEPTDPEPTEPTEPEPTEPEEEPTPTTPEEPVEPETPVDPSDPEEPAGTGETITGDGSDNVLVGTAQDDTIDGRGRSDTLSGLAGNDILIGDSGSDTLSGGDGDDLLLGGRGKDTLMGDDGDDQLDGFRSDDIIDGGAGNDLLIGGHGYDILSGGDGDDTLQGGYKDDILTGGAGADKFRFRDDTDHDTVTDFEDGIDLIDLSHFGLDSSALPDLIAAGLSAVDGGVQFDMSVLGTSGTVLLEGIDRAAIDETDFLL